jgi:hypothetical protein
VIDQLAFLPFAIGFALAALSLRRDVAAFWKG